MQRAALSGLTKTVGRDMAEANGPPQNTTDRIRRWKRWYEEGGRFHAELSSGTAAADDAAPRRKGA